MKELLLKPYVWSTVSVLVLFILYPVQLFVGDVAQEKMGRTPGTQVIGTHDDFGFRADRAASNSLESMPFMLLMILTSVALATPPLLTNILALLAMASRVIHMLAYYADSRQIRGLSWLAGLLIMLAMSGNMCWAVAAGNLRP